VIYYLIGVVLSSFICTAKFPDFGQVTHHIHLFQEHEYQLYFIRWMNNYQISYESLEELHFRYDIFKDQTDRIAQWNFKHHYKTATMNQFGDITNTEFNQIFHELYGHEDFKSNNSISFQEQFGPFGHFFATKLPFKVFIRDRKSSICEGDICNKTDMVSTPGKCNSNGLCVQDKESLSAKECNHAAYCKAEKISVSGPSSCQSDCDCDGERTCNFQTRECEGESGHNIPLYCVKESAYHECKTSCDCTGSRNCSRGGYCQGEAEQTDNFCNSRCSGWGYTWCIKKCLPSCEISSKIASERCVANCHLSCAAAWC